MRNPHFDKLLKECEEIHDKKNTDYASKEDPLQNLKACTRIGLAPFMVRLLEYKIRWPESRISSSTALLKTNLSGMRF